VSAGALIAGGGDTGSRGVDTSTPPSLSFAAPRIWCVCSEPRRVLLRRRLAKANGRGCLLLTLVLIGLFTLRASLHE